jgi:hypothetical protein
VRHHIEIDIAAVQEPLPVERLEQKASLSETMRLRDKNAVGDIDLRIGF